MRYKLLVVSWLWCDYHILITVVLFWQLFLLQLVILCLKCIDLLLHLLYKITLVLIFLFGSFELLL